ncbi:unnamed protein product, partial [Musa acuminata subsp. burmannicoides]
SFTCSLCPVSLSLPPAPVIHLRVPYQEHHQLILLADPIGHFLVERERGDGFSAGHKQDRQARALQQLPPPRQQRQDHLCLFTPPLSRLHPRHRSAHPPLHPALPSPPPPFPLLRRRRRPLQPPEPSLLRCHLRRCSLGTGGPQLRHAAPSLWPHRPRHRRCRVRRHPLLARVEEARRRRGRPRQLQFLLRPLAQARPPVPPLPAWRPRGGRRHQRHAIAHQAPRRRPLLPRPPPRRPGRRPLRHAQSPVLRHLQRRRPRRTTRGGCQARRPPARHRLGFLLLCLRPQHRHPLLRAPPHRPARLAVRRDQESRRGHRPHLQPHLRPLHNRPPLLHRLRAMGPPRHGLLLLHQQHPPGQTHHPVPRAGRHRRAARLHLHRRRRQGLPRRAGHRGAEHRQRRQEARPRAAARLQPRQHVAGAGGEDGGHPGGAAGEEGQEARGDAAAERRRAVHARQREHGREGLGLPGDDRPRHRAEEVCEVVRGVLRQEGQKGGVGLRREGIATALQSV